MYKDINYINSHLDKISEMGATSKLEDAINHEIEMIRDNLSDIEYKRKQLVSREHMKEKLAYKNHEIKQLNLLISESRHEIIDLLSTLAKAEKHIDELTDGSYNKDHYSAKYKDLYY